MNPRTAPAPLRRRLLAGSACLSLTLPGLLPAQEAPAPSAAPSTTAAVAADAKPVVAEKAAPEKTETDDGVVVMSPFEVVADTKGYYAANSMSGTRFNAKLEDIASPISVMTKEQMADFAMVDLNDVFLYTASTEGTGTFTDYTVDRNGQLTDNVQLNPATANRVRGMASANMSLDNIETMARIPIDALNTDAIEVSRGPNASIFGLGNPSGSANQLGSTAGLNKNFTKLQARVDNYGSYRGTFDVNQALIKGALGLRVSGGYQKEEFERKPSGTKTKRLNVMLKAQPFKNTTLTAAYWFYDMKGNRPNYTPPRDNASYWIASGRPGWDPVTGLITLNGTTYGMTSTSNGTPLAGSTIAFTDALLPSYFNRGGGAFQRSNLFVDQTGVTYWVAPTTTTTATPVNNASGAANQRRLMGPAAAAGANLGRLTTQPLFTTTPSVSSKEMYDYSEINLSAVNRLADRQDTIIARLDQIVINTPKHFLAAQLAFMREDLDRYSKTPLGNSSTSGQTGQLWADVNIRNLDGTINPYFGSLYMGAIEPITRREPQKWDTYRGQAMYRLDFTKDEGWTKWLGMHQIAGYAEEKFRIRRQFGYRDVLTSAHSWTVLGQPGFLTSAIARANQSNVTGGPQSGPNVMRTFYRYYVGDAVGGNVDYAPVIPAYGQYTYRYGNPGTGFVNETATFGELATTDSTGGGNNSRTIIKTPGGIIQSQFLDGRFVASYGVRMDYVYSRSGATPQLLTLDNQLHDVAALDKWQTDNREAKGRTTTLGLVARPFRDVGFVRSSAEASGARGFVGQLLRGFAPYYNKSDNFLPQAPAIDLFQNRLPNTTGQGEDYGFWLTLGRNNELVIRVNKYETTQFNKRDGDANTVAQRVLRLDFADADARELENQATLWLTAQNPTWTPAQLQTEVNKVMGLAPEVIEPLRAAFKGQNPAGNIAATNDVTAKGTEIEINYNPSRHWTISANATEQRSINSNVSNAIADWIALRMPIWTTVKDPRGADQILGTADDGPVNWWNTAYGGGQTPAQNYATFVESPYAVLKQQEGKSLPSVRRYNFKASTTYQLAGLTDHRIFKNVKIGGALRWEDKGAIGYYGVQKLPDVITRLDPENPIWDGAHTYLDFTISYRTKLFSEKVGATFQLNARNVTEKGGRLQAIGAFPDGTPNAYRIVDPRVLIFTATFDL